MLLPLFGRSLHKGQKITKTFNLSVNPVNHVGSALNPHLGQHSSAVFLTLML